MEVIMTCRKCNVSQTEVCKSISDLLQIYLRLAYIDLFVQRSKDNFPKHHYWIFDSLKSALNDFESRLILLDGLNNPEDLDLLAELKRTGGFHVSS